MNDFAKMLLGSENLLAKLRAQLKAEIKRDAVQQFTLIGVILLLGAMAPDQIAFLAERAFDDVKRKHAGAVDPDDLEDFEAIVAEVRAETLAIFEKMQAVAVKATEV